VQQSIEEKLEKKTRMTYGASPGKTVAIFVDDINMPAVEEYGA
jgi:dynein heavy chain